MGCLHNQPFLTGYIIKKYTISGGRLQPHRRRTTKFVYFAALPRRFTLWSAPPLSRVEPRPFSFILPSAKIHFSVGFSFIPSKHSFDGNPFLPFVGALRHFVPLFLIDLPVFSVRSPYAVGATPCGRPNQWENFYFAAVHRFFLLPTKSLL